jgi:hypothetical protein
MVNFPKHNSHMYANYQYPHFQAALGSPGHRARLDSITCRAAAAFLDTSPTCPQLTLSDSFFIVSCHFRLGASGFVSDAPLPKHQAIVVPDYEGTMPSTPLHASACPADTNTSNTTSSLKLIAVLPVVRVSLPPANLFTDNLTPLATLPATLVANSTVSSPPDLDQQPMMPLLLSPTAPHLLPLALWTLPALPLPLLAWAARKHQTFTSCLGSSFMLFPLRATCMWTRMG